MTDSNAKINMLIRASCPGTDTPAHELHRATLLLEYLRDEIASLRTRERAAERAVKQAQLAVDRGKEAETLASLFRDFKKEVLPRCIRGSYSSRVVPDAPVGVFRDGSVRRIWVELGYLREQYPGFRECSQYRRTAPARIGYRVVRCAFFEFNRGKK